MTSPLNPRSTTPLDIANHAGQTIGSTAAATDLPGEHPDTIEMAPPASPQPYRQPARPAPDPAVVSAAARRRQQIKRNERRVIIGAAVGFSVISIGVGMAGGYTVTNPSYAGIFAGALIAAVPVALGWTVGITHCMVIKPALQERRQRGLAEATPSHA